MNQYHVTDVVVLKQSAEYGYINHIDSSQAYFIHKQELHML